MASIDPRDILLLTASGVLAGALGTGIARNLARRLGTSSRPNPIVPQHTEPVPYLGGIGVAAGIAAALLVLGILADRGLVLAVEETGMSASIAVPALLFLLIGLIDDLRELPAAAKFALQFGAAVLALVLGLNVRLTGIQAVDGAVSVVWILAVVNAVNFTDVCDGFAAGISALIFMFAFLAYGVDAAFSLAAAGACAGFLVFNRPDASIFLGDAGSNMLGFLIAALAIAGSAGLPAWPAIPAALLIAGLPLFELLFTTGVRLNKRLAWWRGSPDHVALRLQQAGLSKLQTDIVAWAATIILGISALLVLRGSDAVRFCVLAAVVIGCAVSWRILLKWEVGPG